MDERIKASLDVVDTTLLQLQETNKRLARLLALAMIISAGLLSVVIYLIV